MDKHDSPRGSLREKVGSLPLIRRWVARRRRPEFVGSETYWVERYAKGGNSGAGSYERLAEFKAEMLNAFVAEQRVQSVIEYGCGDGNQLRLARYPSYCGFDVSAAAVALCRKQFDGDATKRFALMEEYRGETADFTMSLDVVYHLVEDAVFVPYMERLFDSSRRFVVVFSSNHDEPPSPVAPHVRHRAVTDWIGKHCNGWTLERHIPNRYPYKGDPTTGSFADFYFYRRTDG